MILPVDNILPQLESELASRPILVLEAPPGAGKTTRVPLALLQAGWLSDRKILMLEPRRLAARNAAEYMAGQLGEKVGQTVGYTIRFEQRTSRQTRIEVVTEGILVRRLQSDPELTDIGLVIFDEFHERNIHSDLGLALTNDLRKGLREDLRILVMSATLDATPLVKLLEAGHLRSEGRSWPVDIRYLGVAGSRDPVPALREAIRRAAEETSGDILTFLPGVREIEQLRRSLQELSLPLLVCPLHGRLSREAQLTALKPATQRKLILATNIAETSLTIDGVAVVIDSGLCRRAGFNAGAGLDRLDTARISQASSEQRAGRAGRQGPGVCYRLWSAAEQSALLPQTPAEISACDLAPLALDLACWGLLEVDSLDWLDPPPAGGLKAARRLLQQLGLLDSRDRPTAAGRKAVRLPLHPRFASMLLYAEECGQLPAACLLSAYLTEGAPPQADSFDLSQTLTEAAAGLVRGQNSRAPLARAFSQLARKFNVALPDSADLQHDRLAELLLKAYPDRLAWSRQADHDFLLANGQGARLPTRSLLLGSRWLVVYDISQHEGRRAMIRSALQLEEARIEELRSTTSWEEKCEWDAGQKRIEGLRVKRYGELVLSSQRSTPPADQCLKLLCERISADGAQLLNWDRETLQYLGRLKLLHRVYADPWPELSRESLLLNPQDWLGPYLTGITTTAQLGKLKLLPPLQALLDWNLGRQLDQLAPTRISVPSGEEMKIDYQAEEPTLPVKLQQLFGLAETPSICQGRVPLRLELLSPAARPLAVTSDLRNFWDKVYPEVKKEMRGRYPKHPWPDDPWQAVPTRRTKRQKH